MKKTKIIMLIMPLLMCLQGCDQTDEVGRIFTGKTWKLTMIFHDKNKPTLSTDYWTTDEAYRTSMEKLEVKNNFTITFEGFEKDGTISGTYSGRVTSTNISGSWNADGTSNSFGTNQQEAKDGDVLGTAFIDALRRAYKYEGTEIDLRIYFKENGAKKMLLFRVLDE